MKKNLKKSSRMTSTKSCMTCPSGNATNKNCFNIFRSLRFRWPHKWSKIIDLSLIWVVQFRVTSDNPPPHSFRTFIHNPKNPPLAYVANNLMTLFVCFLYKKNFSYELEDNIKLASWGVFPSLSWIFCEVFSDLNFYIKINL